MDISDQVYPQVASRSDLIYEIHRHNVGATISIDERTWTLKAWSEMPRSGEDII